MLAQVDHIKGEATSSSEATAIGGDPGESGEVVLQAVRRKDERGYLTSRGTVARWAGLPGMLRRTLAS